MRHPSGTLHHGWQLTRKIKRKTRCRSIPEFALDDTRRQLDEHRRFVDLVRRFTEVNEMLCEQRLKLRRSDKKTLLRHHRISPPRSAPKR